MIDPLAVFGVGAAILGLAGASVLVQAMREVLAIPRIGKSAIDWPFLALFVIMFVADAGVIFTGIGVVLLERMP